MSSAATRRRLFAAAALLVAIAGCPLSMPLSDQFVVVEKTSEILRAITADETRVRVRDFEEKGGDLEFWSKAVKLNLVDERGYVMLAEVDTHDGRGRKGKELTFETTVSGRPVRYLLAIFVFKETEDRSRIRAVEYVADKQRFESYVADVRRGIAGMTSE